MVRAAFSALVCLSATLVACGGDRTSAPAPAGGWAPGQVLASLTGGPRGMLDLRGLIHAHSVYSHDACDNQPKDASGAIDSVCFEDMRRGICQSRHDFVMLSDHSAHFHEYEFPDVLLYRPEHGDTLVDRGGVVASWAGCANVAGGEDGGRALVMAGSETGSMPIGLEHHAGKTPAERDAAYHEATAPGLAVLRAAGAVVLAQHTENWSPEQLLSLGFDGFEMYNLHANALTGAGGLISLAKNASDPEVMLAPDLALMPIVNEDPRYLERWGTALARGGRFVTTMGTDCHRNSFKTKLPDGERIDSYRRMMIAFSNHLLVRAKGGKWDDRDLKDALRGGRLYGAFEMMGYPEGFDYRAEVAGAVHEMGEKISLAASPNLELVVARPHVRDLRGDAAPPEIRSRLLVAVEGGWTIVSESSSGELRHKPGVPGAYRVEVRMRPRHLLRELNGYGDLAEHDFVWIYSNAIYLAP